MGGKESLPRSQIREKTEGYIVHVQEEAIAKKKQAAWGICGAYRRPTGPLLVKRIASDSKRNNGPSRLFRGIRPKHIAREKG